MWRDILIILGFVFAGLSYFGLTPRRLAAYGRSAKRDVTSRRLYQHIMLFIVIALTVAYIFVVVWKFEAFRLSDLLLGLAVITVGWCSTLSDVWKLSKRGEKVVDIVSYSVILPLFVATIILSDLALWQKLAYPVGGVCLGIIIGTVGNRRTRKREDAHLSGHGDK